ncbi:GNAT family N-acetyltransferase [Pseudolysinimonas sp.]|uniref:GNAT family N-acetyltransferase n=1 Tax=Pseudolysinimonas sp. TaxID=2680009 RepID=UPI0037846907
MLPAQLRTARLVLDQPSPADVDLITEYCQDPLFEQYLTTPWPYVRAHAAHFVDYHVPTGWTRGTECTWAIRSGGALVGVIALRAERDDVGFWLGAPHRGLGYGGEALSSVCDFAFSHGRDLVRWECVVGNTASAATARSAGFTYTGEAAAEIPARDGSVPLAWHGILSSGDSRERKPGWPIP